MFRKRWAVPWSVAPQASSPRSSLPHTHWCLGPRHGATAGQDGRYGVHHSPGRPRFRSGLTCRMRWALSLGGIQSESCQTLFVYWPHLGHHDESFKAILSYVA